MTTFFALVDVPYEMLRRWFIEEKKSGKDIAKILHDKHQLTVTRNAVMGRLHRLGIARKEIAEPSRASRAESTQIVAAIPALAPLPATPIPKPVAKKKPAMPKEKSGGARFGHGRRSRLPKTRVAEMQASDLGLDSFGEFAHLKDTATVALLEKELEKPVEAIPQPPEPTRHKILSLPKVVETAPIKKELAATRDVVVWSEIEELIFGPVVPRPDGRKILQHLRDADCRWPVGEDSEGRVLFCSRKCEPGASVKFCPRHADGAFQGTSRTKAQSEIDRNRALMAQASKKKMPH